MTVSSFRQIVEALNGAGVRYLVVGGIAVIAHGYVRLTVDVDLMLQLEPQNIIRGLSALAGLGFRPTIPVTSEDFADAGKRQLWIEQKQMKVLKLYSDAHRETSIDVFVSDPLGFEEAIRRVHYYPLAEDVQVPVCGYEDLVKLKLLASRPKDLLDLDQLKKARGESDG